MTVEESTCSSDEDLGVAARQAVEQGLGPDVAVEQRGDAAHLGQGQRDPHEERLIAHEEGDGVTSLHLSVGRQHPGYPVALSIGLTVCVRGAFKDDEGFLRVPLHLLQETSQKRRTQLLLSFHPSHASYCSKRIAEVVKDIRIPDVKK